MGANLAALRVSSSKLQSGSDHSQSQMRAGGNGQPQAYHRLLAALRGVRRTEHLRAGVGKGENR